jgi:hypothetical protein
MPERNNNTFFTKDVYDAEIGSEVNSAVQKRIYDSNVTRDKSLPIEFFYISDREEKLNRPERYLSVKFPEYSNLNIQPYNDNFELSGITHPVRMKLEAVNEWNRLMWDIGYLFDCKLDGWQVGT